MKTEKKIVGKISPKSVAALTKTLAEYQDLRAELKRIEAEVSARKDILEEATVQAGGRLRVGTSNLSITHQTRESVKLKEAREVLGEEIEPFVSRIEISFLRVS